MLSRNQIRIKIFHCIYSSYMREDLNNLEFEKSFNDYIQLYYKTLTLLVYIKKRAEFEIDHGLQKKITTESDLNPNKKFVNNLVLTKIESDLKSDGEDQGKKILAKKIFSELKSKKFFISYMKTKTNKIKEDKNIIKKILIEELIQRKEIGDYFENESIYWNDDFLSVQILLSNMINQYTLNSPKSFNFKNATIFKNKEDEIFAKNLLLKTIEKKDYLTKIIHDLAKNWDVKRISSLDLILMQLAIVEMTEFDSIPCKVSMNEYIEISKIYSTKKSHEFINGILDSFFKKNNLV